jgi:hypothetical protein
LVPVERPRQVLWGYCDHHPACLARPADHNLMPHGTIMWTALGALLVLLGTLPVSVVLVLEWRAKRLLKAILGAPLAR